MNYIVLYNEFRKEWQVLNVWTGVAQSAWKRRNDAKDAAARLNAITGGRA